MEYIVSKGITAHCRDIRMEVFVYEQGFEEEFDDIDDNAFHVVFYKDNKPVATGRTFEKSEGVYKFGRIAVKKEYRGLNYGKKVVSKLEQVARDCKAKKVMLSSQYHAKDFYEKCGYSIIGEPYLEEGVKHILMEKNI